MRVFTCDDHDNHWVGVASVVVAEDEANARAILDAELIAHGLRGYDSLPYKLTELRLDVPSAVVLQDGDY